MRINRSLLMLALIMAISAPVLVACSSNDKNATTPADESVDVLYERAQTAMEEGRYRAATRNFDELERQHPYSQWAKQSQLMSAFASYKDQRYDEAVITLDRFIELHPGHKDVDYAYYLKALSFYEQISDVARDQIMTKQAMQSLETVIRLFPESKYARDSQFKYDLTLDHLAGKEMEIGRYYLNRGHINAAINRFLTVVKTYETTTHTPEALHRLVEAYLTLGLKNEATRIAAVLGHNYPGSKWYERSYKLLDDKQRAKILDERGIIDRTIDSILKPD